MNQFAWGRAILNALSRQVNSGNSGVRNSLRFKSSLRTDTGSFQTLTTSNA